MGLFFQIITLKESGCVLKLYTDMNYGYIIAGKHTWEINYVNICTHTHKQTHRHTIRERDNLYNRFPVVMETNFKPVNPFFIRMYTIKKN